MFLEEMIYNGIDMKEVQTESEIQEGNSKGPIPALDKFIDLVDGIFDKMNESIYKIVEPISEVPGRIFRKIANVIDGKKEE